VIMFVFKNHKEYSFFNWQNYTAYHLSFFLKKKKFDLLYLFCNISIIYLYKHEQITSLFNFLLKKRWCCMTHRINLFILIFFNWNVKLSKKTWWRFIIFIMFFIIFIQSSNFKKETKEIILNNLFRNNLPTQN
jgi:hypothetical protein